jgi:hypothetical protein
MIYREFWTRVPGVTAQTLEARIAEAASGTALPLCRLALEGDDLLGVINLIEAAALRCPVAYLGTAGTRRGRPRRSVPDSPG